MRMDTEEMAPKMQRAPGAAQNKLRSSDSRSQKTLGGHTSLSPR